MLSETEEGKHNAPAHSQAPSSQAAAAEAELSPHTVQDQHQGEELSANASVVQQVEVVRPGPQGHVRHDSAVQGGLGFIRIAKGSATKKRASWSSLVIPGRCFCRGCTVRTV